MSAATEAAKPWIWSDSRAGVEVRFVGRPAADRRAALGFAGGGDREPAWAEQVHGREVLAAVPGRSGRGDALVTSRHDLALAIATADCVPVIVGGGGRLTAAHAGWRGIAAGVVPAAVDALGGGREELVAWVGPAIGSCCYEVGPEVAERVVAASTAEALAAGADERPHLDLVHAVVWQLERAGASHIEVVEACTRCSPDELWSYRRDGPDGGRNYAFAWLTAAAPADTPAHAVRRRRG